MAEKRMIHSKIQKSKDFGRLTFRQKAGFLLLIVLADDQGRFLADAIMLRSLLFPFDAVTADEIEEDLQAWASKDMVYLYEVDGERYGQIVNWWKHQQPQWASPSELPAPEGWVDRVRYRANNEYICDETAWKSPGGFIDLSPNGTDPDTPKGDDEPDAMPDEDSSVGDYANEAQGVHLNSQPEPPTEGTTFAYSDSSSDRDSDRDSVDSDCAALPRAAPARAAPRQRKRDPLLDHPAIVTYRDVAHLTPAAGVREGLAQTVGDDADRVAFWRRVVLAWIAMGWKPQNIKGMLEFFARREIPGDDKGRANGRRKTGDTSGIDAWLEREREGGCDENP